MPKASIIIPTLGRGESLKKCVDSIFEQTYSDYEVILDDTKGLAKARNSGAEKAKGDILIFIDDDIVATKDWLKNIVGTFEDMHIGGVTGPTIIPDDCLENRDLAKFYKNKNLIYYLYEQIIMEGYSMAIGRYYSSGAFSFGANYAWSMYTNSINVDWLHSCNMSIRQTIFKMVNGFDEAYGGCGDFSEPDIGFKIRKLGYKLMFHPKAAVYHCVSRHRGDIIDSFTRTNNLMKFHHKWFKLNWRYICHLAIINTYWIKKTIETRRLQWLGGLIATWKCLLEMLLIEPALHILKLKE